VWVVEHDFCPQYKRDLINKIPLIFDKSVYNFPELSEYLLKNISKIKETRYTVILVSLLLKYLQEKHNVLETNLEVIKKQLIYSKKVTPDNFVPTVQEILHTLSRLSPNNRLVYLVYVVSGIRKVEGKYLLDNLTSLKCQQLDGFVKVTMNYLRHNKNSYFCYLPSSIFGQLVNNKQLSIGSLEAELKRKKLISIKYCRKWFYTKCIELGVPESIADYYQGRSANSVGSNHYLSRQLLADQNYRLIVSNLNSFNL